MALLAPLPHAVNKLVNVSLWLIVHFCWMKQWRSSIVAAAASVGIHAGSDSDLGSRLRLFHRFKTFICKEAHDITKHVWSVIVVHWQRLISNVTSIQDNTRL